MRGSKRCWGVLVKRQEIGEDLKGGLEGKWREVVYEKGVGKGVTKDIVSCQLLSVIPTSPISIALDPQSCNVSEL